MSKSPSHVFVVAHRVLASLLITAGSLGGSVWDASGQVTERETIMDEGDKLHQLLNAHTRQFLELRPTLATMIGIDQEFLGKNLDGKLGDFSPQGAEELQKLALALRDDLRSLDRSALAGRAAVTYDVVDTANEAQIKLTNAHPASSAGNLFAGVYRVTQLSGPQLSIPQVMQVQQQVAGLEDAEGYLQRLEQLGRVIDQTIACLHQDAEEGVMLPAFAQRKASFVIRAFTRPAPVENSLVTSFETKLAQVAELSPTELSPAERTRLMARAVKAVETGVYPAYDRLADALDSYGEKSPAGAGVWRLPNGAAMYALLLEQFGAAGKSADQIHEIGLAEVDRISAEMDKALDEQGLTEGTVGQRMRALYADERFLYANTDAGRKTLIEDLNGQLAEIAPKLPSYFGTVPPQQVEVRRIPAYEQEAAPGGYYTPPALDGSRPGIYWINLRNTAEWPSFSLKTLTYHEANPGHHFQIALKFANKDMPVICQLLIFGAFTEGWALYTEKLAAEMGLYEADPFGNLGRLQSELFRAVRLVVDTGLHHKQWTRDRAIQYMVATVGNPQNEATTEVERYAVWPGQACSYKLGMIKIVELRRRAEAALGDGFDLREFHDLLLVNGDVPLTVLEAQVDSWIAEQ